MAATPKRGSRHAATPARPATGLSPAGDSQAAADRVARRLRDEILRGDLRAGERLREVVTSARMQVSRNTVREAFRILAIERLVEQEPNRGVAVAAPGPADIADIYAARIPLEMAALANAPTGESSVVDRMRGAIEDASEAASRRDWQGVLTADLRFHQRLVEVFGSQRLDVFFENLLAQLRLALSVMEHEAHGRWLDDNMRITDLLAMGRRRDAHDLLHEYLKTSERTLLAYLSGHDIAAR